MVILLAALVGQADQPEEQDQQHAHRQRQQGRGREGLSQEIESCLACVVYNHKGHNKFKTNSLTFQSRLSKLHQELYSFLGVL